MKVKLVADSSANLRSLDGADFAAAALKIVTDEKEYVDDSSLDCRAMLSELRDYKGKSGTACPAVGDWLECFDDADMVLGVAITSNLSGAYNSGRLAAEQYMEENPGKKAYIHDSLSTGPEMHLMLEKYMELIEQGLSFEEIVAGVQEYSKRTHLYFSLESLANLAKNGRVSHAIAAAVGILGIRIVGRASSVGTLEQMHKCRGEKRAINKIYECMKEEGFKGGKARIAHAYNDKAAAQLSELILADYPDCDLKTYLLTGLCCFYAEENGVMVGFES